MSNALLPRYNLHVNLLGVWGWESFWGVMGAQFLKNILKESITTPLPLDYISFWGICNGRCQYTRHKSGKLASLAHLFCRLKLCQEAKPKIPTPLWVWTAACCHSVFLKELQLPTSEPSELVYMKVTIIRMVTLLTSWEEPGWWRSRIRGQGDLGVQRKPQDNQGLFSHLLSPVYRP